MFKNYFKAAVRNLWRNRTISTINIIGLSIGFGLFLIIWASARYEKDFDTFHANFEKIYQLRQDVYFENNSYKSARAGGGFASILKDRYPSVDYSCRVSSPVEVMAGKSLPDGKQQYYTVNKLLAVDSSFFKIFSFRIVKGKKPDPMEDPGAIVITESLSEKIFGDQNPLNETLTINGKKSYIVTAVVEDPPMQSTIDFECLVNFNFMELLDYNVDGLEGTMFFTYALLGNPDKLEYINSDLQPYIESIHEADIRREVYLQPFSRAHLYGEEFNYYGLYIYTTIGILILLIACINFINLTTAFSLSRTKEISIRKLTGASRRELIIQLMSETALIILIAFYLGIIIAEQAIPVFSKVHEQDLSLGLNNLKSWSQLIMIFLATLVVAGLYPSLRISAFRAIDFFQGRESKNGIGNLPRKILVVVQFIFSIIFIITTIYMSKQYTYLQNADLGFVKENVIYFPTRGDLWKNYPAFREKLIQQSGIVNVTTASDIPSHVLTGDINWGKRGKKHDRLARIILCDENFAETFEIGMKEGRFYDPSYGTDFKKGVVVNEYIAKFMGWEENLGRDFYLWEHDLNVIGISEDIRFFPFNIGGINANAIIYKYEKVSDLIFIRLLPDWTSQTIQKIETIFNEYNQGYPFDYFFLEDYKYDALNMADSFKILFLVITSLGIIISSIGLFGLSLYSTSRRRKEIGIRKAMGSTSREVYVLLIREFISLVLLANIISQPIAYLVINMFSQIFAYRADITAWIFIFTFLLTLILSAITVGFQAFRVARSNPVDSLRYE